MRQKIDCFLACERLEDAEMTVSQLRDNKTIHNIYLLTNRDLTQEAPKDCRLLSVQNLTSTQTMMRIAENAAADYVLLCTKTLPLLLGPSALERLYQVASDSNAAMVYSDRLVEHPTPSTQHPTPNTRHRHLPCRNKDEERQGRDQRWSRAGSQQLW